MMRWFRIITLLIVPVFSLHYDETTHSYNDLLVSISPDLPGKKMIISTWRIFCLFCREGQYGDPGECEGLDH